MLYDLTFTGGKPDSKPKPWPVRPRWQLTFWIRGADVASYKHTGESLVMLDVEGKGYVDSTIGTKVKAVRAKLPADVLILPYGWRALWPSEGENKRREAYFPWDLARSLTSPVDARDWELLTRIYRTAIAREPIFNACGCVHVHACADKEINFGGVRNDVMAEARTLRRLFPKLRLVIYGSGTSSDPDQPPLSPSHLASMLDLFGDLHEQKLADDWVIWGAADEADAVMAGIEKIVRE